ncbi:MAG: DNA mismatch repair endonuclease MutL [Treponema sp.]|jgi:DNA mismatch repair protein MutL|nr:DNA mismatch repair endonuclease MutL [Treponema sp.]
MIRILPPEEARKIAAGEVIDRPAALVRELLDNALDAGASNIEVSIEEGGAGRIEVIDDGAGMSREDLALCTRTHATSKITSLDDLSRSLTLGFRGEALAAAAAAARLSILSGDGGGEAWLLETSPGETGPGRLVQSRRVRGTSVRASGLFDAIPARKRFLKQESGEAALCRQVFVDKALAFPAVSFRFVRDGVLKLRLAGRPWGRTAAAGDPAADGPVADGGAAVLVGPAADGDPAANEAADGEGAALQGRFGEMVFSAAERGFLHRAAGAGRGFRVTVIFGGPELYRRDRRLQYIYANRRRIQDFGLMQALEYGLSGFFPNGSHPAGMVFVEVDPALADFNIHPAKREVRFADPAAIHHCVSSLLRDYVRGAVLSGGAGEAPPGPFRQKGPDLDFGPSSASGYGYGTGERNRTRALAMEALLLRRDAFAPLPRPASGTGPDGFSLRGEYAAESGPSYGDAPDSGTDPDASAPDTSAVHLAGRAFGLFIIAVRGDRLYLIDQHAAHERILYDHYVSRPPAVQELLVSIPFCTGNAGEERFLAENREALAALGIGVESDGGGAWRIEALPAGWRGGGDAPAEILALRGAENMTERWAAALACRGAVKDGEELDDAAALALAREVIALGDRRGGLPRCPHGRPLWKEISREDLFRAVRRRD